MILSAKWLRSTPEQRFRARSGCRGWQSSAFECKARLVRCCRVPPSDFHFFRTPTRGQILWSDEYVYFSLWARWGPVGLGGWEKRKLRGRPGGWTDALREFLGALVAEEDSCCFLWKFGLLEVVCLWFVSYWFRIDDIAWPCRRPTRDLEWQLDFGCGLSRHCFWRTLQTADIALWRQMCMHLENLQTNIMQPR